MPVGAIIGGAVIGAGGAIGASAIGSHAQTKAAQTAATTAQNTTDSNNQLFRETRGQNIAIAAPFYNNGLAAGNALQSLLLGDAPAAPAPAQSGALAGYQTSPGYRDGALSGTNWGGYLQANPDLAAEGRRVTADGEFPSLDAYAQWHYQNYGQNEGRQLAPASPMPGPTPATAAPAGGALDAFARFRGGTNYQWRYDQGLKSTESAYATRGALDSGAAEKAKISFGQNLASNELSNYMNLLAGQQQVGLSAGNAIMGVSTSAANNIAGQNTNASNVAANAALTSGQANANLWGAVGNTAGQVGGALFQYGMGQFRSAPPTIAPPNYYAPSPVNIGSTPYTPTSTGF